MLLKCIDQLSNKTHFNFLLLALCSYLLLRNGRLSWEWLLFYPTPAEYLLFKSSDSAILYLIRIIIGISIRIRISLRKQKEIALFIWKREREALKVSSSFRIMQMFKLWTQMIALVHKIHLFLWPISSYLWVGLKLVKFIPKYKNTTLYSFVSVNHFVSYILELILVDPNGGKFW